MGKKSLAADLTRVLADSFVLYFTTHSFHWNVTGPHFKPLHDLFEEQYTELWTAIDEIAERIRILGEHAPVSYDALVDEYATNVRPARQLPDADDMVAQLAEDHRLIIKTLYVALKKAEEIGDEATVDLVVGRIAVHEKAAWMLESSMRI